MSAGCGEWCRANRESEGKVQMGEMAQVKSPGVERGQPICRTDSSLVQPHVEQQVSVQD